MLPFTISVQIGPPTFQVIHNVKGHSTCSQTTAAMHATLSVMSAECSFNADMLKLSPTEQSQAGTSMYGLDKWGFMSAGYASISYTISRQFGVLQINT